MGRKKVSISKITNERNLYTTFSKRKFGIWKKAYELSILCDCEVSVIILKDGRLHQYASSDMDHILLKYSDIYEPHESRTNEYFIDLLNKREMLPTILPKDIKNIETQPGIQPEIQSKPEKKFATQRIKMKFNDISDEEFARIMNYDNHYTTIEENSNSDSTCKTELSETKLEKNHISLLSNTDASDDDDMIIDTSDDNFADIDDSMHINSYNSIISQQLIQPIIEIKEEFINNENDSTLTNNENDGTFTNNVIKDNTIATIVQVPLNDNPVSISDSEQVNVIGVKSNYDYGNVQNETSIKLAHSISPKLEPIPNPSSSDIGKNETLKHQNHFERLQYRPYNILSKRNDIKPRARKARGQNMPQNSLESECCVQQFQGDSHTSFQKPRVCGPKNKNKQPDSQQDLISKPSY